MPVAHLILFTRYPHAGTTKTRLISQLGARGAADLQQAMSRHLVTIMRHSAALPLEDAQRGKTKVHLEARSTGASPSESKRWLGIPCKDQGRGGLGERLIRAFSDAFSSGATVVAVLGGDCPQLTGAAITAALQAAHEQGAALIPATDGGYCLLALRSDSVTHLEALFTNIDWGTGLVATQQQYRLTAAGIAHVLLSSLCDVDIFEDLSVWNEVRRAFYEPVQTLSVILPTYKETQETLTSTLKSVQAFSVGSAIEPEILVVDAVEVTVPNRAAQMNLGAARATGDALLFLHADTHLPPGGISQVFAALADPTCALGAFSFAFDAHTPTLDLFAANTRLRGKLLHSPYGDQAYFCRRAFFESLGGFPNLPRMEDFEFMRRANRVTPTRILKRRATTSARRYEQHPWQTMLSHRREVVRYLFR